MSVLAEKGGAVEKGDFQVYTLNQQTGDRRVNKIKMEYEKKGYAVLTNKNFNSGVDVIVIEKVTGKIVLVIESTNWSESGWMQKEKLDRYVTSLNWFNQFKDVEKQLYVSFKENLRADKDANYDQEIIRLKDSHIDLVEVGYQE